MSLHGMSLCLALVTKMPVVASLFFFAGGNALKDDCALVDAASSPAAFCCRAIRHSDSLTHLSCLPNFLPFRLSMSVYQFLSHSTATP